MTCEHCNTKFTCAEKPLCAWTDSKAIGGFPELQSEPPSKAPTWIVYGLIGAASFVLLAKWVMS